MSAQLPATSGNNIKSEERDFDTSLAGGLFISPRAVNKLRRMNAAIGYHRTKQHANRLSSFYLNYNSRFEAALSIW